VFLEPVDFTRVIPRLKSWLRLSLTPTTPLERHLGLADLLAIRAEFPVCHIREFYVLARLRKVVSAPIAEWLKRVDCLLLTHIPWARRFASGVVIQVGVAGEQDGASGFVSPWLR